MEGWLRRMVPSARDGALRGGRESEEVWDLGGGAARVVDEDVMGAGAEGSDAEEGADGVGTADGDDVVR